MALLTRLGARLPLAASQACAHRGQLRFAGVLACIDTRSLRSWRAAELRPWHRALAGKAKRKHGKREAAAAADKEEEEDGDEGGDEDSGLDPDQASARMDQTVQAFRREVAPLRPGRASPHLLDHITVAHPNGGEVLPLPAVGRVIVRDPQRMEVAVFDPQLVSAVARAIASAGMELNPQAERSTVVVPLPRPTAEQRKAMVRTLHRVAEKAKNGVRRARQGFLKRLKADKGVPEDDRKALEAAVQKVTDAHAAAIADHMAAKEKELLEG